MAFTSKTLITAAILNGMRLVMRANTLHQGNGISTVTPDQEVVGADEAEAAAPTNGAIAQGEVAVMAAVVAVVDMAEERHITAIATTMAIAIMEIIKTMADATTTTIIAGIIMGAITIITTTGTTMALTAITTTMITATLMLSIITVETE